MMAAAVTDRLPGSLSLPVRLGASHWHGPGATARASCSEYLPGVSVQPEPDSEPQAASASDSAESAPRLPVPVSPSLSPPGPGPPLERTTSRAVDSER